MAIEQRVESMDLIQSDKRRLIVGLGVTGLSCLRHFVRQGIAVSVFDTRENPPNLAQIRAEFPDLTLHLGVQSVAIVDAADEIYLSPGIAPNDPFLAAAVARGAVIRGDMDLFAEQAAAPIIAISGSNAKSTVTSLVGEMARCAGLDVGVGGNLGTPALELLSPQRDCYVLELSSFQLERCETFRATVGCVLNVSADHIDRHENMINYHRAKQSLYRGVEVAIFNRDDGLTTPLAAAGMRLHSFSLQAPDLNHYGLREFDGQSWIVRGLERLLAVADIPLVGRHNLLNVVAALAIGEAAGFELTAMQRAVKQFRGLPHRCEAVACIDGVRYINDSKATNVAATVAAIEGLSPDVVGKTLLIAGGVTKSADFSPLVAALAGSDCQLLLYGEGAATIAEAVPVVPLHRADNLAEAVAMAAEIAAAGDLVLLSPACASFDQFRDFSHRGEVFVEAVEKLAAQRGELSC